MSKIEQRYNNAKEIFAEVGVDTEKALQALQNIKISMQCWQGDDVAGFVKDAQTNGGGILATGNYLGRATNAKQLREDASYAFSLIPGKHKFNLHAIYAEDCEKLEAVESKHFENYIAWAKDEQIGLDYNPSCFKTSNFADNLSITHPKFGKYWLEHCIKSREISDYFGKILNQKSMNNFWFPDGFKEYPANALHYREQMIEALNKVFAKKLDNTIDCLESKLFGIGVESYTVVSNELQLNYCLKNNITPLLDLGHYHLTESVADKLSSIAPFHQNIALHTSRPVRWDSDHIPVLNDDLQNLANAIIYNDLQNKVLIGLDFFDASINRIAAWVLGVRNTQKALLIALLTPFHKLQEAEKSFALTDKIVLTEEFKALPFGAVYDYFCETNGVDKDYLTAIKKYENEVLNKR